jgi:hypothetical protein
VHKSAEEKLVHNASENGDANERMRAMIDIGEAIVAHVPQPGATKREHKAVCRLDRHLGVLDAVDQ